MKYMVSGVCSRSVEFDIEDGIVKNVVFEGGCNGNTKGIAKLVEGMDANEVIHRLRGTTCGHALQTKRFPHNSEKTSP